jgi:hypothetical protein
MYPGKTDDRISLPFDVTHTSNFGVRVVRDLIVVTSKRCDKPELILRTGAVDKGRHSARSPDPIV